MCVCVCVCVCVCDSLSVCPSVCSTKLSKPALTYPAHTRATRSRNDSVTIQTARVTSRGTRPDEDDDDEDREDEDEVAQISPTQRQSTNATKSAATVSPNSTVRASFRTSLD